MQEKSGFLSLADFRRRGRRRVFTDHQSLSTVELALGHSYGCGARLFSDVIKVAWDD